MQRKILAVVVSTVSLTSLSLLVLNSFLESFLSIQTLARAGIMQGYEPPERGSPQRTEASGSRGCEAQSSTSLTLLVPNNHVATTVSEHPVLLFYLTRETSRPIRLTLVEPGVSKPIFEKELPRGKSGFNSIKLPSQKPGLAVGKKYRWVVAIVCNPKRPSESRYAQAKIKRVSLTPELRQKVSEVNSNYELSQLYAGSGVWYDAISTIYRSYSDNPGEQLVSKYFWKLLEQVGLQEVQQSERQRWARQNSSSREDS